MAFDCILFAKKTLKKFCEAQSKMTVLKNSSMFDKSLMKQAQLNYIDIGLLYRWMIDSKVSAVLTIRVKFFNFIKLIFIFNFFSQLFFLLQFLKCYYSN